MTILTKSLLSELFFDKNIVTVRCILCQEQFFLLHSIYWLFFDKHIWRSERKAGINVAGGDRQVTIPWDTVSSVSTYNLYWSTSSNLTTSNGTMVSNVISPYTHTGLTNGRIDQRDETLLSRRGDEYEWSMLYIFGNGATWTQRGVSGWPNYVHIYDIYYDESASEYLAGGELGFIATRSAFY